MIKSYKSIEVSIPSNSDYTNYIPENVHGMRWIVVNDSTSSLLVKVNSLENDAITIKSGEYYGEAISFTKLFIKNEALSDSPVRIRIGAVEK